MNKELELICDLVAQGCTCTENGKTILDSMAISTYADALRYLAEKGIVKIIDEHGRRVIAEWKIGELQ